CHLTLPLLMLGVLADDAHDALAAHHLALRTDFFDRSPDLHWRIPLKMSLQNGPCLIPSEFRFRKRNRHGRLRTTGPSSVMATECSKWAESLRSLVTAVHPSASTSTSWVPALTIGSMASTSPGFNRNPLPGLP